MNKSTQSPASSQFCGELFSLSDANGKKLSSNFTAPDLSSFGGLLLLRECEKQIGFVSSLSSCIEDSRRSYLVRHSYEEMLLQRIFQIAAGYEDCEDCDLLRNDSILKICAGRTSESDMLSSQPSMSRLENKASIRELYNMGLCFVEHFISSYGDKEPEVIILDCDDSNANTYGGQQLSLFNNYYGEYCYMPLFVFEGISGKMILPLLRPGRGNKSINIFGIMRRLIALLRKRWKHTRFILRGDSHFCSKDFMDWAEDKEYVDFVTGLTGNSVLLKRVEKWLSNAQKEYNRTQTPIKTYHHFTYKAGSWKYVQRVVVKIEIGEMGSNIRFVVTSFKNTYARTIYESLYCDRARMELMIKEIKTYLYADRMSCQRFSANQFRLFIHAGAYVLLHTMKSELFAGTPVASFSIMTIREKILLTAVHLKELKTCIRIEFPAKQPMRKEMEYALHRIRYLHKTG
jgi:Transposase DDE domain.